MREGEFWNEGRRVLNEVKKKKSNQGEEQFWNQGMKKMQVTWEEEFWNKETKWNAKRVGRKKVSKKEEKNNGKAKTKWKLIRDRGISKDKRRETFSEGAYKKKCLPLYFRICCH